MKNYLFIILILLPLTAFSQEKAYQSYAHYQLINNDSTSLSYLYDTITQKKLPIPYPYTKYRRHQFRHGFVYVRTGDMKGLMDLEGKKILSPCHFIRFNRKDSLISAYVCRGGSWINLDFEGDTISYGFGLRNNYVPRLLDTLNVAQTLAVDGEVDRKGTLKYGYLDKKGQWKIPPIFDMALPYENGKVKVKWKGKWYFTTDGVELKLIEE